MTVESAEISTASSLTFDLPPALATPPGAGAVCDDQGARKIGRGAAEGLFTGGDVIVAHAGLTARRLGLAPPSRSAEMLDALELFAFVRPARFCAPSATGLALALGREEPRGPRPRPPPCAPPPPTCWPSWPRPPIRRGRRPTRWP